MTTSTAPNRTPQEVERIVAEIMAGVQVARKRRKDRNKSARALKRVMRNK